MAFWLMTARIFLYKNFLNSLRRSTSLLPVTSSVLAAMFCSVRSEYDVSGTDSLNSNGSIQATSHKRSVDMSSWWFFHLFSHILKMEATGFFETVPYIYKSTRVNAHLPSDREVTVLLLHVTYLFFTIWPHQLSLHPHLRVSGKVLTSARHASRRRMMSMSDSWFVDVGSSISSI